MDVYYKIQVALTRPQEHQKQPIRHHWNSRPNCAECFSRKREATAVYLGHVPELGIWPFFVVSPATEKGENMKNQEQGFTLIELLVVILIIGILAAVAVPQYQRAVEKSHAAESLVITKAIAIANNAYYLANGAYATDIEALDIEVPGTSVIAGGMNRRQSNWFEYGARASYNTAGTVIALANRLPKNTLYSIEHFDTEDLLLLWIFRPGIRNMQSFKQRKNKPR